MNINIKKVKISTISQEIKETLKQGQTVIFQGSGDVIEARFRDQQDGTTNAVYVVKPILVDIRNSEKIRIVDDVKLKEKSRSQALRQKCFVVAQELGDDADELYARVMDYANDRLDQILEEGKL